MPADRAYNVLFLCTGNSARSIFGEAILNHVGEGRFKGFSAGSHPKGEVNPRTIATLEEAGISTEGLRSKSSGTSRLRQTRRRWTSSLQSVTTLPARLVRSGRVDQ